MNIEEYCPRLKIILEFHEKDFRTTAQLMLKSRYYIGRF